MAITSKLPDYVAVVDADGNGFYSPGDFVYFNQAQVPYPKSQDPRVIEETTRKELTRLGFDEKSMGGLSIPLLQDHLLTRLQLLRNLEADLPLMAQTNFQILKAASGSQINVAIWFASPLFQKMMERLIGVSKSRASVMAEEGNIGKTDFELGALQLYAAMAGWNERVFADDIRILSYRKGVGNLIKEAENLSSQRLLSRDEFTRVKTALADAEKWAKESDIPFDPERAEEIINRSRFLFINYLLQQAKEQAAAGYPYFAEMNLDEAKKEALKTNDPLACGCESKRDLMRTAYLAAVERLKAKWNTLPESPSLARVVIPDLITEYSRRAEFYF